MLTITQVAKFAVKSLLVGCLFVGAAGFATAATDVPMTDRTVMDRVERNIQGYDDVTVEVNDGVVTLKGSVKSESDKDAVVRKARDVSGVTSVRDDLRVRNNSDESGSVGRYIDDAAITTVVKSKFLGQKGLDSMDISVETVSGVVTLDGRVDNQAQVDLAERTAKEADGVRGVVNKLQIKR